MVTWEELKEYEEKMRSRTPNYFEVLYSDCFNRRHVYLMATYKKSPSEEEPFKSGQNGIKLLDYKRTTFQAFQRNEKIIFREQEN